VTVNEIGLESPHHYLFMRQLTGGLEIMDGDMLAVTIVIKTTM